MKERLPRNPVNTLRAGRLSESLIFSFMSLQIQQSASEDSET